MWNDTPRISQEARVTFKQLKTSAERIDSQNTNLCQAGNGSMVLLLKKKRDYKSVNNMSIMWLSLPKGENCFPINSPWIVSCSLFLKHTSAYCQMLLLWCLLCLLQVQTLWYRIKGLQIYSYLVLPNSISHGISSLTLIASTQCFVSPR